MNKYRSAMEKIASTPQMEERILGNLANGERSSAESKKPAYFKWTRHTAVVAACFAILLGAMITYQSLMFVGISGHSDGQQDLGNNPIVNIAELEELKKSVPFELLVPEKLPAGHRIDSTSIIAGTVAQIIYSDGSNEITYRAAKGAGDISGDSTIYEESYIIAVGDAEVRLKGNQSLINLATWTKDGCTYSLSSSNGFEKETVMIMIESQKKV